MAINKISLVIYGEPVPKGRPRFGRIKVRDTVITRAITPDKTRKWEDSVKAQALEWINNKCILTDLMKGPLILTAKFYRPMPKRLSMYQKAAAMAGVIRPVTRPDLDNYIKSVEDALNGIIWTDDAQVVEYGPGTGKYYGEPPRVEITVEAIYDDGYSANLPKVPQQRRRKKAVSNVQK